MAFGAATHWALALHTSGATQSATDAHRVLHAPVPLSQRYGSHSRVPPFPASPLTFMEV
jgi:hypothetical protein